VLGNVSQFLKGLLGCCVLTKLLGLSTTERRGDAGDGQCAKERRGGCEDVGCGYCEL
jgi:hypothetical protein